MRSTLGTLNFNWWRLKRQIPALPTKTRISFTWSDAAAASSASSSRARRRTVRSPTFWPSACTENSRPWEKFHGQDGQLQKATTYCKFVQIPDLEWFGWFYRLSGFCSPNITRPHTVMWICMWILCIWVLRTIASLTAFHSIVPMQIVSPNTSFPEFSWWKVTQGLAQKMKKHVQVQCVPQISPLP